MFRRMLILTAIILVFAASNLQAEQIHSTWVDGEIGQWDNALNWDPPEIPMNYEEWKSYRVTISKPEVTIGLKHGLTLDHLDCYGKVNLENWTYDDVTLYFPESPPFYPPEDMNCLANHGDLFIGQIDIGGDVRNLGGAKLEFEEHINIFGDLYNKAGATITVDMTAGIDVEEGGEVYNDGLIRCIANGGIGETPYFHNNGEIQLFIGGACNGAIFDNNSTAVIQGSGAVSGQQLHNKGTIRASMGPLLLYFEGSLTNSGTLKNDVGATLHISKTADVNNQGTIEASADGSVVFDCNLVNEPNGVIKLLGGTLAATTITQTADANFAGFGGITGDVIIDPDGLIKLTGPTNIVGDVNVPAGATLKISDGQTLITGHTTCDGTIHLIGGTVIFQGGCDCDGCNIINEAGTDRNHFDINADGIEDFKDFAEFANNWLWQATWY